METVDSFSQSRMESIIPQVSVIIPCFNEEGNIHAIFAKLQRVLASFDYEILFVDDGSQDKSLSYIQSLAGKHPEVRYLSFRKNSGHQNALRAGLKQCRGQYALTMDCDLQHPPEAIPKMLAKIKEGFDVVYMVRQKRQRGFLKNFLSAGFYKFFNKISSIKILPEVSDFRIINRKVLEIINALPERNLVLRVMIPNLGFSSCALEYELGQRNAGKNAYTFSKSLNLAVQSIFNFTTFPLTVGFRAGLILSLMAFLYGLYAVYVKVFTDRAVPGYTDIICTTLVLGGVTLIYLGIIGKYISIILEYLKQRPEFLLKACSPEIKKVDADIKKTRE